MWKILSLTAHCFRGEVLARWHDFVGTGDFFRSLENRIGRLRDRFAGMLTGNRQRPRGLSKLSKRVCTPLFLMPLNVRMKLSVEAGERNEQGAYSYREIDESPYPPHSTQARAELDETIAAEIRAWQSSVLDMIRAEGSSKRQRARVLSSVLMRQRCCS